MKRPVMLGVVVVLTMILIPQAGWAQKRSTRRKPAGAAPAPPPDLRPRATEVAEQIKLLSRFLFVFGKVANGLEVARDQARRNQTSPAIEARNRQSREALVSGISGLATGIDNIVNSFKSDPNLQVQYLKLAAARDAVNEAAQFAAGQQYEEAGSALTAAIERLTETIISMRLN